MLHDIKVGCESARLDSFATNEATKSNYAIGLYKSGVATTAQADCDAQLATAVQLYLDRQDRVTHPVGYFGSGDKWYPSDEEFCDCCKYIRKPSWKWPWSLNKHCRSAEHVAALMDVDATDLRRAVRSMKTKKAVAQ
jgi:hypothetical protein